MGVPYASGMYFEYIRAMNIADEITLEKAVARVFDCDESYANKIIASLRMNLPIQGATPLQMYLGYGMVNGPSKEELDKISNAEYPKPVTPEAGVHESVITYRVIYKLGLIAGISGKWLNDVNKVK